MHCFVPPLILSNQLQSNGFERNSAPQDRKSTRLNSSHEWISYAVFCLKKKKEPGSPSSRAAIRTSASAARTTRHTGNRIAAPIRSAPATSPPPQPPRARPEHHAHPYQR